MPKILLPGEEDYAVPVIKNEQLVFAICESERRLRQLLDIAVAQLPRTDPAWPEVERVLRALAPPA